MKDTEAMNVLVKAAARNLRATSAARRAISVKLWNFCCQSASFHIIYLNLHPDCCPGLISRVLLLRHLRRLHLRQLLLLKHLCQLLRNLELCQ